MLDEDDEIRSLDSKIINEHTLEDKTYLMTDYDFYLFKKFYDYFETYLFEILIQS